MAKTAVVSLFHQAGAAQPEGGLTGASARTSSTDQALDAAAAVVR